MSYISWYKRWHSYRYHEAIHYIVLAIFTTTDFYLLYQLKAAINLIS